ncbi:MAG: intradiol ring-cleavage dioxygenase [Alphaproteobacteria bacterium]|nr:intradiol ring-cleavage dioxygenase [Alphaproteobacteria bacterium]|tara:strand:- start:11727 stop:12368 length:642 start_codon:yes stop_codon:yes gene_type:complete
MTAMGRRSILRGGLAILGHAVLPTARAGDDVWVPTPAQTAGPFYPDALPDDIDQDLIQIPTQAGPAKGIVTMISRRVLDVRGMPLAGAQIEIWQCDANGRYIHSADSGRGLSDPGFQGYGRAVTESDGSYWFRTIRPVPYTGRTPHIHFTVQTRDGRRLTTQMYVAGEGSNARDCLYRRLPNDAARRSLTVALVPAPQVSPGALAGRFDIIFA